MEYLRILKSLLIFSLTVSVFLIATKTLSKDMLKSSSNQMTGSGLTSRLKIENQIAEINNNSKYSKVLAAVNVMEAKEKSLRAIYKEMHKSWMAMK